MELSSLACMGILWALRLKLLYCNVCVECVDHSVDTHYIGLVVRHKTVNTLRDCGKETNCTGILYFLTYCSFVQ